MEETKQQKAEREKLEGANLTPEEKKRQRDLAKAQKLAKKDTASVKQSLPAALQTAVPPILEPLPAKEETQESKQEKAAREKGQGSTLTDEEKKRQREQVKAEK